MARDEVDLDRVIHGTLFGEAVTYAGVAALLADGDGQYVAANEEACRLTGYTRGSLVEFRAGELAADEPSRRIYDNISRGRKLKGRKTIRRRDGENVTCRYWAIPTRVAHVPYYLLLLWRADAA
ncbi:MAG TPA: PAS domain-containing protein [Gaiellaceae bacterium]